MPPLPEDTYVLLCTNLVLTMGWINSPELFCDTSKTVSDNMNIYALDPESTFMVYPPYS